MGRRGRSVEGWRNTGGEEGKECRYEVGGTEELKERR